LPTGGSRLAIDLVRRQVAVIVVDTTTFAQVAKAATQTIPSFFGGREDRAETGPPDADMIHDSAKDQRWIRYLRERGRFIILPTRQHVR